MMVYISSPALGNRQGVNIHLGKCWHNRDIKMIA